MNQVKGREHIGTAAGSPPQLVRMKAVSVVMVGPDHSRRRSLADALGRHQATVVREFSSYPNLNHLLKAAGLEYDILLIDLDSDPDTALDLVESICARGS